MLTRRDALILGASAALFPAGAAAQQMQFSADHILDNLRKSIWISTNRKAKQAAYVIAAPWCPFCKQFYHAQAEASHDIDFRYIMMSFRQFGPAVFNAYMSGADDQVGAFYANSGERGAASAAQSAEWMDNINVVTVHLMAQSFRALTIGSGGTPSAGGFSYPTIVQLEQDGGVFAAPGGTPQLARIIEKNGEEASKSPIAGRYQELLSTPPRIQRTSRGFFAKKPNAPYYSAPLKDAPLVEHVEERRGYQTHGVATFQGEEWISSLVFSGSNALKWARKADFFSQ